MKIAGFLILSVGFLAGAYFLTGSGDAVNIIAFVVSLVSGIVGVIILRVTSSKRKGDADKVSADIRIVTDSLQRLVDASRKLESEKESIDVYDLAKQIDDRFREDLGQFVDARESMIYASGLPAYAEVMSQFAAGERYLNRVWSCSVDGYIDEAHAFLGHARDRFVEAQRLFNELKS